MKNIATLSLLLALACSTPAAVAAPPKLPDVIVKGDLIADLRPDLTEESTEWINHATGDKSVGNFKRLNKSRLPVASTPAPDGKTEWKVARFNGDGTGAALSTRAVPREIAGSGNVSVETWVKAPDAIEEHACVIGFGNRPGNGKQREFLYGSVKPFSGFFADVESWGAFTPDTGVWHHLVWTYEGASKALIVYVDGKERTRGTVELDTDSTLLAVGAGATEESAGQFTNDPFNGYIAVVRIASGALSAADVKNNFAAGALAIPPGK